MSGLQLMNAPLYGPGDKPYLRESAALGYLEPIQIKSVTLAQNGSWLYSYQQGLGLLRASTYGDRRSLANGLVIWLDESELIDYFAALKLIQAQLQHRMNEINNLIAAAPS